MAQTIKIRGFVKDDDGSSPSAFTIFEDGTEDAVTVGAGDILYVETYAIGATTGVTTLFFSDDGANDQEGARIAQFVGWGRLAFPKLVSGRAGDNLYLGSSGVNRIDGTFTGFLYQA